MSHDGLTAWFLESRVKKGLVFLPQQLIFQLNVHAANSKTGRTLGRTGLHGGMQKRLRMR